MSRKIQMILILSIVCLLSSLPVSAGECPPGSDCFLCGGVGGIPCTTLCTGVWDENTHSNVACRCPQGQPCECYCPYVVTFVPMSTTTTPHPPPPVSDESSLFALIAMKQYDVYAPSMVDFTDASTGPVSSRLWDFGDNQRTSQLKSPTIIFSEPGTYVVTLTVVDAKGTKATDQVTVRVLPAPATGEDGTKDSSEIPLSRGVVFVSVGVISLLAVKKFRN